MIEEQDQFCAQLARESGEPLLGTATGAAVWLLLEYRGVWQSKAVKDNDLPEAVQRHLAGQLEAVPGSRLLFIKRQEPLEEALRFFVVKTDDVAPAQYEFRLSDYGDLLGLDARAVVKDSGSFKEQARQAPLFLVCTNGRRDRCCAKFGRPVYGALQAAQADYAWQSTHIGGHRYAPNVLFLPHSVNYGWLSPDKIDAAAAAYLDGRLFDLDFYRGRTYHAPPVQAADYFLRRELNLLDLAGLRLRSAELSGEDIWTVQFELAGTGETHAVMLQSAASEQPVAVSCTAPASKPVPRYRLLEIID